MEYSKPPLSFQEQANCLLRRGLVADENILIDRLKNVNYYRLSGYLYPYREENDNFKKGTTFDKVWRHYAFDRRLRLIVMDAIERVEVSIKTQLIYALAHQTQAFGYLKKNSFPKLSPEEYNRLINTIIKDTKRSRENFVSHFNEKYGDLHDFLPLWMTGEIISFGSTLTIYKGMSDDIKKIIAVHYKIPDRVLTSWLQTINVIRNICAHHSRLWNRELGVKPCIPKKKKYPEWHHPVVIPQNRIFGVLTILNYLLKIIAPQSKWNKRLLDLLEEYKEISRWSMGFPDGWEKSLLWMSEFDIIIPCKNKNTVKDLLDDINLQTIKPNHIEITENISPNGRARNIGTEKCKSDILIFLDQDVRLGNNDLLFRLCETLNNNSDIGLAGASVKPLLNLNAFQKKIMPFILRNNIPVVNKITESDIVTTQCCAIKRELFNRLNGFDENLIRGVDPEFRYRVREHGLKICFAPESYFYHPIPKDFFSASKLFFRNGQASGFANKYYPDKIFDVPADYTENNFKTRGKFKRKLDFVCDLFKDILRLHFLKVYFRIVYIIGYLLHIHNT